MPDKKLTDTEIIKALECCIKDDCEKCPLGEIEDCITMTDTLDLINRLQAENENLTKACENQQKISMDRYFEIERLKTENKHYAELEQGCYVTGYKNIKSEAYKEFAERLKKKTGYEESIEVADIIEVATDNLLKELVGKNE